MMNFQDFELLYGSAQKIRRIAETDAVTTSARISIRQAAEAQMELLKKQFKTNFPKTMGEAVQRPDFDATQFFDMLQKWPELIVDRKEIKAVVENLIAHGYEIPESGKRLVLGFALNPE